MMSICKSSTYAALAVLLCVAGATAHLPADNHFAKLFESVTGDVPNTTAPVTVLADGGIPDWLHATKFNNGFGKFEGKNFKFKYLFDVMSYIVKWRIDGNKVTFANKFLESKYLNQSRTEIPPYRTFAGYDPPMSKTQDLHALVNLLSDNLNVNIIKLGNRLVTISDMAGGLEIDPLTLETIGPLVFNDSTTNRLSVITCAHPSRIADDQYLYNYYVNVLGNFPHWSDLNKFQLYRVDLSKGDNLQREIVTEFGLEDGHVAYVHSFANTPNYLVFFHFPLFWDVEKIMFHTHMLPTMEWKPSNGTRVRVIEKSTWKVVNDYWTEPVFAYHHINAYEEDDHVVVDITTVPCNGSTRAAQCDHMNAFDLSTLPNNSWPIPGNVIKRYQVPIKPAQVPKEQAGSSSSSSSSNQIQTTPASTVVTNVSFDLPGYNNNYRGKKYRYVYGVNTHSPGGWWTTLIKVDLQTGETIEWYEEDHYATEPNFVPRPGATEEDDGVLLSVVLGGDLGTSYLLVLDAKTMKPLARALAPHFLPFLSHGFAEQD